MPSGVLSLKRAVFKSSLIKGWKLIHEVLIIMKKSAQIFDLHAFILIKT